MTPGPGTSPLFFIFLVLRRGATSTSTSSSSLFGGGSSSCISSLSSEGSACGPSGVGVGDDMSGAGFGFDDAMERFEV